MNAPEVVSYDLLLSHLQLSQKSDGPLVGEGLVYTDDSGGELSIAACDLGENTPRSLALTGL